MTEGGCDRLWQVDAYRAGLLGARDREAFERHARACATCRARLESDERLRDLARALPYSEPSPLSLRRLRTRILHDAHGGDPLEKGAARRRRLALGALVASAASVSVAVIALVSRPGPRPAPASNAGAPTAPAAAADERLAGTVVAASGARWTQARSAGIERVDLAEGSIRVQVRRQVAGERFLVELPDGEIEVRGTSFDVDVERGATRLVEVAEGIVELRLNGRDVVRLGPLQSWPRSDGAPGTTTAAPPPPAPPVPRSTKPTPLASPGSDEDPAMAYADAVQALRAGRYAEAASQLHAFILANPALPQAEDASFLEAVALARAGRADAAALAAEHHLARFPASFHAREAAVFVARAASERRDCNKARSVLAPWMNATASADVSAALGSCRAEGSRP